MQPEILAPATRTTDCARESSQKLARLLADRRLEQEGSVSDEAFAQVEISLNDRREVLALSHSTLDLLEQILSHVAQGNAVTIHPHKRELTTVQASELLNVSRPYLIGLLEKGDIPFHKVGTHRRVLLEDVLQFKRDIDAKRLTALRELSELSQELGLDD